MLTPVLIALLQTCAPMVATDTMQSVITVERAGNPWAIGVVGGKLTRQPQNRAEAIATAQMLSRHGWNYSVGTAQVNQANFARYGLTLETVFEPCRNINAGGRILQTCYSTSLSKQPNETTGAHLQHALSCYYTGYLNSRQGRSYANKVFAAAGRMSIGVREVS